MAHHEPPHLDLSCLLIQLFSSLVVKELKLHVMGKALSHELSCTRTSIVRIVVVNNIDVPICRFFMVCIVLLSRINIISKRSKNFVSLQIQGI